MTDYLHRVGRVGRCSGDPKKIVKSRVTSFIRTIQEVQTAKAIEADDMVFDVLVGEPADVSQFLRSIAEPPKIGFIVFDEADMLLNDNYVKVMTDFLSLVPISSSEDEDQARAVFVAATCPDDLQTIAEGVVEADQLFYVRSEFLHKPLPNIEQMFIRIKEMDKVAKLKEILDEDSETSKRKTMVFCKDRRTAIFVHKTLSAADIGSRGLDIADLKHVINYDFPWHMTDYLHRVGRVGRCSGDPKKIVKSRVTSFIRTIQEVQTAKAIETAIRFGKPLQNVDLKSSMKYQKSRKSKKESEKNVLPDKPTLSE
uniref:Helicase C-terminal domain-containing protein n=1 Tax=Ditylenchus dipsaci TaxID=166011 RepID=A0A915D577_9BILA